LLERQKYLSIFHARDYPELRELFSRYEGPARRVKSTGLKAGFWAIGFGFAALALAPSELLLANPSGIHPGALSDIGSA
jgi:hypothetical protein